MFEIDRAKFGAFVSELRKEKGITQKELAEKLCISDKAISKWETGNSIPDVSLLVPLADILGVSVTELLECRRMETPESLDMEQTDKLVKKVIELSEEDQAKKRKKNTLIYLLCVFICLIEFICIYPIRDVQTIFRNIELMPLFMIVLFSIGFGAYFWIFIKEKLPSYYDENEISVYVDGVLHMNMLGVVFNNNNWPYIVKALRGWSLFGMVAFPVLYSLLIMLFPAIDSMAQLAILLIYVLGGLLVPVYILGRKYRYGKSDVVKKTKDNKKRTFAGIVTIILIVLAICFGDITSINSSTRIMYAENKGINFWNAQYQFFDGFMQRTLWMEDEDILNVSIETDDGEISLQIIDENGNVIYREKSIGTAEFEVEVSGKIIVRVDGEEHEGSFSFK